MRFRSLNSDRSIIYEVIRRLLSALSSGAEQISTERGPPLVHRSATIEARRERAKLGEAKSVKIRDISSEGASFPAESNFLAVATASTAARNRVRISVTENGSVAASRTAVSSRDDRSFHRDYYFAPLPHGSIIGPRGVFTFIIARSMFLPLKIIGHRLVFGDY